MLPPPRGIGGPVAQWLEPAAHNGLVAGSSPAGPTNKTGVSCTFSPLAIADHETINAIFFGVGREPIAVAATCK